jgi:hypothetical protein
LPLQAIETIEAKAGRKSALEFARQAEELEVKLLAALAADVTKGAKLLREYDAVMREFPPNARKVRRLRKRLDQLLADMLARIEKEIS